jgi:arsenite methyltransferase
MYDSVKDRYSDGAKEREAALCCPVSYRPEYLEIIPKEVIDRDYGCGDPSLYVREGETVLDLGSGGGKVCFIAAQIVGEKGRVIGVDANLDMLDLARKSKEEVEAKMGYKNLEFHYGFIQDLALSLDWVDDFLVKNPVNSSKDLEALEVEKDRLRKEEPMIPDNSVDVVISNCVLNLVGDDLKQQLFEEMFRVVKVGGRIAISDIVSDEDSPVHLKEDGHLWSGCISGALQEKEFIQMLEDVGFYGIEIDKYEKKAWQIVEGIEYRSVTITAFKGKEGDCLEKNQAVIYKGPWKSVEDDDGHIYERGERMAVCEKNHRIMTSEPYKEFMIAVDPYEAVKEEVEFDCSRDHKRLPRETKEGMGAITTEASSCCEPGGDCC